MNLTRLGHYFVPTGSEVDADTGYPTGSCQTALVVGINEGGSVNLACWQHDGDEFTRDNVDVGLPGEKGTGASFHLSLDCPWLR